MRNCRLLSLPTLACLALIIAFAAPSIAPAITIKGANGKAVEFHTIQSAAPKGLAAKMAADGPVIGVTWDKIDLAALATEHPDIFAAYERTKAGETVELGLTDGAPDGGTPRAESAPPKYPGWLEVQAGKMEFMLQLPTGEPRGILLLSLDDYGESFHWVMTHERGSGPWADFQNKHSFALLAYHAHEDRKGGDPTVPMAFMSAEKGSGAAVLSALKALETKLKKPGLAELPIAIYGIGRAGSAFAYSFMNWKPERVLAAAITSGAFYDAAPTEASAKVPVVFVWGEYDNRPEIWHSENDSVKAHANGAALKSVWTSAMESKATSSPSAGIEYFGKAYLLEMIPLRMPKEPGASQVPADPAVAPASPPAPSTVVLSEVRRDAGMIGNLETGETTNIADPQQVVGEDETFLPNANVAKIWKMLLNQELEPPAKAPR